MKTVISALVALSVLSGYAASAFADKVPQSIWEQLDREGRGGHPTKSSAGLQPKEARSPCGPLSSRGPLIEVEFGLDHVIERSSRGG